MIGYYVHNHGSGHRHRALAIARRFGEDITLLGSLGPAAGIAARYAPLPRDDVPLPDAGCDVTANGSLHWAPVGHRGQRDRQLALVRWLETSAARLLVSDVSVEVLLLARLLSVAPVAVALRGNRMDRAHASGYDAAVHILAPWTQETQHEWPARWLDKTTWTGMISRFDGRRIAHHECERPGMCVVLMLGRGGHAMSPPDLAAAVAGAGTHWHVVGNPGFQQDLPPSAAERLLLHGDVADPWPILCGAGVVVTAAGNNALAEVAAARVPVIAVPQHRPFDEQAEQARMLAQRGYCVAASPWPTRQEWPGLLARAQEIGGHRWSELSDGQGADRAAAALRLLADQLSPAAVLV